MNYAIASTILGLLGLGGLGGVAVFWLRKRVELNAAKEQAQVGADPIVLLKEELLRSETRTTAREGELAEIRAADRIERAEYREALQKFGTAMDKMASSLDALRDEERAGRAKLHDRIDVVDKELLVIKTRLEPHA